MLIGKRFFYNQSFSNSAEELVVQEEIVYPTCKFPKRECVDRFEVINCSEQFCDVHNGQHRRCPYVDKILYVCEFCKDTRVGELWYGEADCDKRGLLPMMGGLGMCGDLHKWKKVKRR